MLKILAKKNNRIIIFAIAFIFVVGFLINSWLGDKIFFVSAEEGSELENPIGWSWNDPFGWHSGNCSGNFYGEYNDYCGIDIQPVLDVNFDSQDIDFLAGTVKDNSTNLLNGTLYDITLDNIRNRTGDSNFNQSIYFDGSSSYIDFGVESNFSISQNDSFSISVWFKLDSSVTTEDYNMIFSNGDWDTGQYQCYVVYNQEVVCNILGQSISTEGAKPEKDKWYNLTITYSYDNDVLILYFSNENDEVIPPTNTDSPNYHNKSNSDLLIGKGIIVGSQDRYFKGEIDEFRLFRNALTPEQVAHNMVHNSNYSVNIANDGSITGYIWNQGLGWICLGQTCSGNPPHGNLSDTKLNWQGNISERIYPSMVTGWAKVINSDSSDPDVSREWISLQGHTLTPAQRNYSQCVGCVTRDREDGLVGYWKFDEGSGDVVTDSSGFSSDGQIINFEDANWVLDNCVLNNCFFSKNEKSYIKIDNMTPIGLDDFSFEIWVKMDNLGNEKVGILEFLSEKFNLQMFFDVKDRQIKVKFLDYIIEADGGVILDQQWHHIVFTADRSGYGKIYFDGKLVEKSLKDISKYLDENIEDNILIIGGATEIENSSEDESSTAEFKIWSGKLDVVRMYKKVLSLDEIQYNYQYIERKNCSACFDIKPATEETKIETQNICYECNVCYFDKEDSDEASDESTSFYKCETCSSCNKYGLVFDSNTASIKGYAWAGDNYGWIQFGPSLGSGIYRSYVSGMYGNIYSKGNIGSDYSITPPSGFYNASYLIQANGHLINWSSESSVTKLSTGTQIPNFNPAKPWLNYFGNPRGYIAPVYEYPSVGNDYGNILGKIDWAKLQKIAQDNGNDKMPWDSKQVEEVCLGGKVYYNNETYPLNRLIKFKNANGNCTDASGVILIDGDLKINNDVLYDTGAVSGSYKSLASVAWIIKGDLIIDKNVENLAGTFIVLGKDDVSCGSSLSSPEPSCGTIYTGSSNLQLKILGQVIAKNFKFERTYKDILKSPAELIIYDGRNIINPPIGLEDVVKALPRWDQIAPY